MVMTMVQIFVFFLFDNLAFLNGFIRNLHFLYLQEVIIIIIIVGVVV